MRRNGKRQRRTRLYRHRLRELILSDLEIYKSAKLSDINERIGSEISWRKIYRELKKLVEDGKIKEVGENRWRQYSLTE